MCKERFDRAARELYAAANSFEATRSSCARNGTVPDVTAIETLEIKLRAVRSAHEEALRARSLKFLRDASPASEFLLT
jgi:hypothetical protein